MQRESRFRTSPLRAKQPDFGVAISVNYQGGHAHDSMHAPSITHDDIFILSLAFAANS
jgi:hypothetical protein